MRTILSVIFMFGILVSCNPTKPVDPVNKGLLRVKVLDSGTQQPLTGYTVGFYYRLDLTDKPLPYPLVDGFYALPNPFTNDVQILCSVFNKSLVKLTVIDETDSTHTSTFFSDSLVEGQYSFKLTIDSTFNYGFHLIKLQKNDSIFYTEVLYTGYGVYFYSFKGLVQLHLILTDNNGIAEISISEFPFIGKVFPRIAETGALYGNWEFVDSIRVDIVYQDKVYADTVVCADKENIKDLVFSIKK